MSGVTIFMLNVDLHYSDWCNFNYAESRVNTVIGVSINVSKYNSVITIIMSKHHFKCRNYYYVEGRVNTILNGVSIIMLKA